MNGIPQVEGTGHGGSLWGLLMFRGLLIQPVTATVG
jgi:hypothetical protein